MHLQEFIVLFFFSEIRIRSYDVYSDQISILIVQGFYIIKTQIHALVELCIKVPQVLIEYDYT